MKCLRKSGKEMKLLDWSFNKRKNKQGSSFLSTNSNRSTHQALEHHTATQVNAGIVLKKTENEKSVIPTIRQRNCSRLCATRICFFSRREREEQSKEKKMIDLFQWLTQEESSFVSLWINLLLFRKSGEIESVVEIRSIGIDSWSITTTWTTGWIHIRSTIFTAAKSWS